MCEPSRILHTCLFGVIIRKLLYYTDYPYLYSRYSYYSMALGVFIKIYEEAPPSSPSHEPAPGVKENIEKL